MLKNINQTIVITGGSSGIGAEAAKALVKAGWKVIITGRSSNTKKLAEEIKCDYYIVDFSEFSDVKDFAGKLLKNHQQINVLVNNVGGIISQRNITKDGHEQTFQINYLSGFLLTNLLRERLEESNAIVINTSSVANNFGSVDFDDLENEKSYKPMKAYGTAKLMNILHAMEINNRFSGVKAYSFHPGVVRTGFARQGSGVVKWAYESVFKNIFMISPQEGADTLLWLIESHDQGILNPGEYYYKRKPGKKNKCINNELASKLWKITENNIFNGSVD